ncbi:MAG: GNAT family N-acetyltransferase [Lactobacillales bacterium]|jgi:predicted GNAT family N-acyltransferase|nr:GNAT family N-acetyltransferase [Lactobacillales bacterium]
MKLIVKRVEWGSGEYVQALGLRDRVLRQPLGLKLSEGDVAGEERQEHIVAVYGGMVVGCVILFPETEKSVARLRQLAVDERYQKQGIGKELAAYFETYARLAGYKSIVFHARKNVREFYEKLGFEVYGDEFIEKGILHIKMRKCI